MRGRLKPLAFAAAPAGVLLGTLLALGAAPEAQRRTPARSAPVEMTCPHPLGRGVESGRTFCDILTGRDPAEGIILQLPNRTGPALLTFDLHNRHTYSADQVKAGRGYARYTATVGALTPDNTLLSRFVVRHEFRNAPDLFDRVEGGAGPSGLKAVAPLGAETVVLEIPPNLETISILGEKLEIRRSDRTELFTTPGRPVAVISQPTIEYRPAQPPRRRR